MNTKQVKALRKEINRMYPNADKAMKKKLLKEGKRQYGQLTSKEKGQDIIELK